MSRRFGLLAVFTLSAAVLPAQQQKQPQQPMSFFITSTGSGKGADLGGLAGADRICQERAAAAGAGNRTWHAYVSTSAANGQPAVNARDRIGNGPWYGPKGAMIAKSVADLHGDTIEAARLGNNLSKAQRVYREGRRGKGFR